MPSSTIVGWRPSSSTMRSNSSGVRPCSAICCGVKVCDCDAIENSLLRPGRRAEAHLDQELVDLRDILRGVREVGLFIGAQHLLLEHRNALRVALDLLAIERRRLAALLPLDE